MTEGIGPTILWYDSYAFGAETPSLTATRTSSATDLALILRMTCPRWTFTVTSPTLRSAAICLFIRPVTASAKTGSVANLLSGQAPSKDRFGLSRQQIELPCRAHLACQRAFPNHVHEFDSGERHRG
jgi:hypothetical protein